MYCPYGPTGYDVWGRPYSLSSSYGTTYVTSATYDALGRLDLIQFGNGYRTDYNYYSATTKGGRLQEIKSGTSGTPDAVQRLVYDYTNDGNVTSIVNYKNCGIFACQTQAFGYDALDRLTSSSADDAGGADGVYSYSYVYNTIGNITSFQGTSYTYSTTHKHAVSQKGGSSYSYDPNGNMTSRPWGSGTQTLTYDYENRLVTITDTLTLDASFAYDADGNRVWQDVDGTEIHFVWDWVESGTIYYYFGGRKIAMRGAGGMNYLYADQVSSTMNTSGGQTSSQLYYPYGDKRGTGSVATPYRYTGQRWEDAIGLYFYNARWYDPALGRFIQPDTIVPEPGNPQALNRYSYGLNNPVKYNDPSGHNPLIGVIQWAGSPVGQYTLNQIGQLISSYWAQAQALVVQYTPLVSQWLQMYGPYMPAMADKAGEVGDGLRRSTEQAGNTADPGSLGPNDPFRNAPEPVKKGVETLRRQAGNRLNWPRARFGARAHLSRAEYYQLQGTLQSVNPTGKGSMDLVLNGQIGVEVKYWTAKYLAGRGAETLANQLKSFTGFGKIIVEFVQTSSSPITQAMLDALAQQLATQYMVDITNITLTLVANPGIP